MLVGLLVVLAVGAIWLRGGRAGDATGVAPAEVVARSAGRARPEVTSVELLPEAPTRAESVAVRVETLHPDGDPVSVAYEWLVNGRRVAETRPRFPLRDLVPGDRVAVRVTPSDAGGAGAPRTSREVVVANRPPVVTSVSLEPPRPRPGAPVSAVVETADPDGDGVTLSYAWEIDGQPVEEVETASLPGERVGSGASIAVTVTPRDPYGAGAAARSHLARSENRHPVIASVPPRTAADGLFLYQVAAEDPDGDALRFVLETGPAGMTLDAQGRLEWRDPRAPRRRRPAPVRILVEDGKGGQAVQQFVVDPGGAS